MDAEGFAFEINVKLKFQRGDVTMTYAGDALIENGYKCATLTLITPVETFERKIIVVGKSYVFDPSTMSWDEWEQYAPFLNFSNPSVLFAVELGSTVQFGGVRAVFTDA